MLKEVISLGLDSLSILSKHRSFQKPLFNTPHYVQSIVLFKNRALFPTSVFEGVLKRFGSLERAPRIQLGSRLLTEYNAERGLEFVYKKEGLGDTPDQSLTDIDGALGWRFCGGSGVRCDPGGQAVAMIRTLWSGEYIHHD